MSKGIYKHIGHRLSEETKRKIGDAHRGKVEKMPMPMKTRIKISMSMKGRHLSPKTKAKLSIARKGKHLSLEHRTKLSQVFKGRIPWNKGKVGFQIAWNKGISCPPEERQRISQALKGNIPWNKDKSPETLARIEASCVGRVCSPETRAKIGMANKGKPRDEKWRKRKSEEMKRKFADLEWKDKHLKVWKVTAHTEESKNKISLASKDRWSNPEYKARVVRAILESSSIRPTKPEIRVNAILQKHFPNSWKYNGDLSQHTIINGLVPDFININGKKQVIEVFGDYYHNPDLRKGLAWHRTEVGRIETYRTIGYDCLVIWESELKDRKRVLARMGEFANGR